MTTALPHRPSSTVRSSMLLARRLAVARQRRSAEDLQRRAAWAEQARHTPTLQSWIDTGDSLDRPTRGPVRIALARFR